MLAVRINPLRGVRVLFILDLRRAYLHIERKTPVWAKPPHLKGTGRCWRIKKHMYGTLDAAAGYQEGFNEVLVDKLDFELSPA